MRAGKRSPELAAFKKAAAAGAAAAAAATAAANDANYAAATGGNDAAAVSSSPACGVWIVKPGALNRGRGIEVFSALADIDAHLAAQEYGSSWIIQKYIEAPILVHGRKFDIRQYAMVAPDGTCHMYRDSYVRTCSAQYDVANLDEKAIHLTNDAVQKVLGSYGAHEAGGVSRTTTRPTLCSDKASLRVCMSFHPEVKSCSDLFSSACSQ